MTAQAASHEDIREARKRGGQSGVGLLPGIEASQELSAPGLHRRAGQPGLNGARVKGEKHAFAASNP